MAQLESVKKDQLLFKAFASLENQTKKTLKMAHQTISDIEKTAGQIS
jgi:hypothetical protein